jgi:hypothetical protein
MANDFALFDSLLTELESLYDALYDEMRLSPTAYFAKIDDVTQEDFKAFSEGALALEHKDMYNVQAQMRCLAALKCFHRSSKDISGRIAGKFPGILLLENYENVEDIIVAINLKKDALKHCVQDRKADGSHGRNHLQKHEFLHQHRGQDMISYQLYRHIDVINCFANDETEPALKSVKFYWHYKNADKMLQPDQIISYLSNAKSGMTDIQLNELEERITQTRHTHRFYIRKTRNAAVNITLYYGVVDGKPVLNTINAAQPIFLTNYDTPPKIHPLPAHDISKRSETRKGHPWTLLNAATRLYTRPITEADRKREEDALKKKERNNLLAG